MPRRIRFLRTGEHEEAVRSLEWTARQADEVSSDPYLWKWVLISLHNAVQGFMVLSLWNGNGLLALRDRVAAKWIAAHEDGGPYPVEKLDEFLNLYSKVKNASNFHFEGVGPFLPGSTHDESIKRLNDFRNEFIHFTPKGWSLELAVLPRICLDALDVVQFYVESPALRWHVRSHPPRAKRAARKLKNTLGKLEAAYGG